MEDATPSSSPPRRREPGKITYGSSGNYGTMHVPMEMLALAAGVKMLHVPYTGAGRRSSGCWAARSSARHGPATIVQHVKGGKVRALAHWGEARLAALPDVPSLKELGNDVEFSQWTGLFVPAGTPEPVVARLREAARAAATTTAVKEVLLTAGSPVQYLDAPEFQRYVDADAAKMADVVQAHRQGRSRAHRRPRSVGSA